MLEAQKSLWPWTVALCVVPWTRSRGGWLLKWAPALIPPFRLLVLNEHGDFFPPFPTRVADHLARRASDVWTGFWPRWRDYNRAIRFLVFTTLCVNYSDFARACLRRFRGRLPLELPAVVNEGGRVAEFRYEMKRWNRAELLELVRDPSVRYIVFAQGNARVETGDLLPLFDDPRTFAVARQSEFRGWQDMALWRAPFRRLEPGSATQTMAPFSRVVVVDRAKLAALGVPDTLVPGAAWFLWFWRAAAGGWRCYTAGSKGRTVICPDWPYEEGEFTSRLLFDWKLRDKGPREENLSRGNIAFPIGGAKPFRGMPRVLVVSPYLPYPLSHGGAVRIYNLCKALSGKVDFLLACFKEQSDVPEYDKLLEVFREVYVLDIDEHSVKDPALPAQVWSHPSASMEALIAELCASRKPDAVQVEYTHMAGFGAAAGDTPTILVEHDLTFTLYEQLAGEQQTAVARAEYRRWLEFESRALARYGAVWVMSEEDREKAIAAGSRAERTFVIPNGVDVERFMPSAAAGEDPVLFYVGSFRHLPNILGFEKLRHEVMPEVWRRFPKARLSVVAGPEPARYWRELRKQDYPQDLDSRIEIHGFVADLRPLYAAADVVVVPLLVSAGTNIKVMEAMACAKPVVTTPVGGYGIGLVDGEDALVRADWPGFAGAVVRLLEDPALRERIGAAARRTVESRFDWKAIGEAARESYAEILARERVS